MPTSCSYKSKSIMAGGSRTLHPYVPWGSLLLPQSSKSKLWHLSGRLGWRKTRSCHQAGVWTDNACWRTSQHQGEPVNARFLYVYDNLRALLPIYYQYVFSLYILYTQNTINHLTDIPKHTIFKSKQDYIHSKHHCRTNCRQKICDKSSDTHCL